MEKPKMPESKEVRSEVMSTPEIVVQEEKGLQLFSLLQKARNSDWGKKNGSLVEKTTQYFKDNPVDPEILKTLDELYEQGADEESLYNAALTYQHPERGIDQILEMAAKYKPWLKDPEGAFRKFLSVLEQFDRDFSGSPLAAEFDDHVKQDMSKWREKEASTREVVEEVIAFFRPDPNTTNVDRLIFAPTDPLVEKTSGRSFTGFQGEQVIASHVDNEHNQVHEFCHSIINPVIEKLVLRLTDEQLEKVPQLASETLIEEGYQGPFNLLCEEFVRTYNDKPVTYEGMIKTISDLTEEDFQEILEIQKGKLKSRCEQLGIETLEDLKSKSREYFDRFLINRLHELILELYQEYKDRPNPEAENFEQFALRKFPAKL